MSDFFDEIEDPYSSFNSRLIKSVRNRYKSSDNFPVKEKYVGIVLTASSGILAREHYMYDQFYEVGGEDIAQKTLQSYKILVKELDDHRYAAAFEDLNRDNLDELIGKNNYDMYDSFAVSPLLEMSKKSSMSFLPGDLVYVNYGLKKQRIGPYIIGTKGVAEQVGQQNGQVTDDIVTATDPGIKIVNDKPGLSSEPSSRLMSSLRMNPEKIIVHSMAEFIEVNGSLVSAKDFLESQGLSVNGLIDPSGNYIEMVKPPKIAQHAGNDNSVALGFEILVSSVSNYDDFTHAISSNETPIYTEEQFNTAVEKTIEWMDLYGIPPNMVLRHSDVSPGRKLDPGEAFDWDRFVSRITSRSSS